MGYFYFDVETCPLERENYLSKDETERKKLLNPIDSRIVAIGVRHGNTGTAIMRSEDEAEMLVGFWKLVTEAKKQDRSLRLVGFNVKDFDLPFVVTRSFIKNVKIEPFLLKEVIDLREKLSAFKFGNVRGKLKEFGELIGIEIFEDVDGSKVAELCWNNEWEKIEQYLRKDMEITEAIHSRTIKLRINEIERW